MSMTGAEVAANSSTDGTLISSPDVIGTVIYGAGDDKVSMIDLLMIDETSGKVACSVMSFGGLMGMGQDHHPVPWGSSSHDTSLGGFRTDILEEQLRGAPERTGEVFDDRATGRSAPTGTTTPHPTTCEASASRPRTPVVLDRSVVSAPGAADDRSPRLSVFAPWPVAGGDGGAGASGWGGRHRFAGGRPGVWMTRTVAPLGG